MLEIKNPDQLIKFIIPLFKESVYGYNDFDFMFSDDDSVMFFLSGGCLELVKVIKHYFPDTKYAIRNDYLHFCAFYDGKLYDAMDYYEDWQLEKKNYKTKEKDLSDFTIMKDEEIDKLPVEYGVINYIDGLEVSDFIINEIDQIESVKVSKKGLK